MTDMENASVESAARGNPVVIETATAPVLDLVGACALNPDDPIIIAGGADVALVKALLDAGQRDITILDPSLESLQPLHTEFGGGESRVILLEQAAPEFVPHRRYALWHDRGVFHSLVHPDDRQHYVELLQQALRPEGHLIITTFGPGGPEHDRGVPVRCYSIETLPAELGRQFELAGHSLSKHLLPTGEARPLLHCRFRRHAPRWPVERAH